MRISRYAGLALLLFVPTSAHAAVCVPACSTASSTAGHGYIKTLLALVIEAVRSPDFTDVELESVDYTLLPPTLTLKLQATTRVEIPTVGWRKVRLASDVTLGLRETTITWKLLCRQGPVSQASGTVLVVNQRGATRLNVKVNLRVQADLPKWARGIVSRHAEDGANATACRVSSMLRKAMEIWNKPTHPREKL